MSGKMPEIIPPPPTKPVSPPTTAKGVPGISYPIGPSLLHATANTAYLDSPSVLSVIQGADKSAGHPPPPPPHSPPPPNPKSWRLHECASAITKLPKSGYPPPPPPHSPPPPPTPKSQSGHYEVVVSAATTPASFVVTSIHSYVGGARIYSMKEVPPSNNIPKSPRPHLDPASPLPPPYVDLNKVLGMFAGTEFLYPKTTKLGASLLPQGGYRSSMVIGCA